MTVTQAKGERQLSKPTTLDTGLKIEQAPLQEREKRQEDMPLWMKLHLKMLSASVYFPLLNIILSIRICMLVGKPKMWLRPAPGPHFHGIFTSQNVDKSFLIPPPLSCYLFFHLFFPFSSHLKTIKTHFARFSPNCILWVTKQLHVNKAGLKSKKESALHIQLNLRTPVVITCGLLQVGAFPKLISCAWMGLCSPPWLK